jgi:protein SMG8
LEQLHTKIKKFDQLGFFNLSNNSLFAIPANQEFVYIHRLQKNAINTYEFLLSTFVPNSSGPIVEREMLDADLFRKFTFSHVDKALKGGFNDNIGRTNVQPVFQLPTLDVAYKVIAAFVDFLFKDAKSAKMKSYFVQLKSNIDIDAQFSENRCKKCLPLAINAYQDNLPLHYTEDQHKQRVILSCLPFFSSFVSFK